MSAQFALQVATHAALTNALTCASYDDVPDNATLPYVMYGESTLLDQSAKANQPLEVTLTLHIFSGYKGYKEAAEIMQQVRDAVHQDVFDLSGDGFTVQRQHIEFEQLFKDDADTRHGVMRLRAIIQRNT